MRVSRALDRLRTQMGVGAAACTAAVLGTLLTEHSVEAAPAQLITRLSALKHPAVAGAAGAGGLLGVLSSHYKLAAGAAALVLLATVALLLTHFVKSPVAAVTTAVAGQNAANDLTRQPNDQQFKTFISANPFPDDSINSGTRIHVFDMDTGKPIAGAKILANCFANREHLHTNYILYTDNGGATVVPRLIKDVPDEVIEMDAIAQGYIPKGIDPWDITTAKYHRTIQ